MTDTKHSLPELRRELALRSWMLDVMHALHACYEHVGIDQLQSVGDKFSAWEREVFDV